jgi:hypothetical protein
VFKSIPSTRNEENFVKHINTVAQGSRLFKPCMTFPYLRSNAELSYVIGDVTLISYTWIMEAGGVLELKNSYDDVWMINILKLKIYI